MISNKYLGIIFLTIILLFIGVYLIFFKKSKTSSPVTTKPPVTTSSPVTTKPPVTTPTPTQSPKPEVFLVSANLDASSQRPGGDYIIKPEDAPTVCSQFGASVATFDQLNNARINGAQWCSTGTYKNANGVYEMGYPTQVPLDDGCNGLNTVSKYRTSFCDSPSGSCASDIKNCSDHSVYCGYKNQTQSGPVIGPGANVHCYGIKPLEINKRKVSSVGFNGIKTSDTGSLITSLQVSKWYTRNNNVTTPDTGVEKWSQYS